VLGGAFALIAAVTFAWTNAAVRRGVVTGTAVQATTLSIPIGVPVFFAALLMTAQPARLWELPIRSAVVFVIVGITHFVIGRYCNYRALAAIGTNLAGPVMQFSLIVARPGDRVFGRASDAAQGPRDHPHPCRSRAGVSQSCTEERRPACLHPSVCGGLCLRVSGFDLLRGKPGARALCGA
jgi:hypothetical protein